MRQAVLRRERHGERIRPFTLLERDRHARAAVVARRRLGALPAQREQDRPAAQWLPAITDALLEKGSERPLVAVAPARRARARARRQASGSPAAGHPAPG